MGCNCIRNCCVNIRISRAVKQPVRSLSVAVAVSVFVYSVVLICIFANDCRRHWRPTNELLIFIDHVKKCPSSYHIPVGI